MLQTLRRVDEIATTLAVCFPAACWTLMLVIRFVLWDHLCGQRWRWTFRSTVRSLCRIALIMQATELAAYTMSAAVIFWLAENDWDPMYGFLRTIGPRSLMLLVPLLAWGPSLLVTVQLLRAPASQLPVRSRICCCRLKRQAWARFFAICALWHALACATTVAEACRLLPSFTMDTPGFQNLIQKCEWDLELRCQPSSWRQVPDTRWDLHVQCALACSDLTVPLDDVLLGAAFVICKLLAISVAWSLLARLFYMHISWKLLVLAAQLARASQTGNQGVLPPDSQQNLAEIHEPSQQDDILTPSAFQQGVSEVVEVTSASSAQRPSLPQEPPHRPAPVNVQKTLSEAGEASRLQVLQAVMSMDRPPSPSGSVASLDLKSENQRPSAEALRNMLENPIAEGHAELVDFARIIARQCSKDSRALSEASKTSASVESNTASRSTASNKRL